MKILTIIIALFLIIGAYMIVKYNNYQLDNPDDQVRFFADYKIWLFDVTSSMKNVVGAAIKEQWLPQKQGNISDTNQPVLYGP